MVDCVGAYGEYGRKYSDEDVIFQEGILTVIQKNKAREIYLTEGLSVPLSLKEIAEKYPLVKMLIYESGSFGYVFRYMNHPEVGWEAVGTTKGYA